MTVFALKRGAATVAPGNARDLIANLVLQVIMKLSFV